MWPIGALQDVRDSVRFRSGTARQASLYCQKDCHPREQLIAEENAGDTYLDRVRAWRPEITYHRGYHRGNLEIIPGGVGVAGK